MNIIGAYRNGNHRVLLCSNGTKVKVTIDPDADHFTYDFPENFDIKINNRCDGGCKYCHENSTVNGEVPNILNMIYQNGTDGELTPFYMSIRAGTEMAIGGGNLFETPNLKELLICNRKRRIVSNVTVNQVHVKKYADVIREYIKDGLTHGVGISLTDSSHFPTDDVNSFGENCVIHVINGILSEKDLSVLKGRKVLILGYKDLRRGHALLNSESQKSEIEKNQKWLKDGLKSISDEWKLTSFDCLGIEQLDAKNMLGLSDDDWKLRFQGVDTNVRDEDGLITCSTMYIDIPNMQVSRMSTAPLDMREKFTFDESIIDLFNKSVRGW